MIVPNFQSINCMKQPGFIIAFLLITYCYEAAAQFPVIDSVKQAISVAPTEQKRLEACIQFLKYRNSLSADTIAAYTNQMYALAVKLKDQKALRWAEYNRLTGLMVKGRTDSVLYYIDSGNVLNFRKQDDRELYYKLAILKANIINRTNDRAKALDLQLALLSEAKQDNDTLTQLFLLNYLGATYLNLSRPVDARNYWDQGLKMISQSTNPVFNEINAFISSNLQLFFYNSYLIKPTQAYADSFLLYSDRTIGLCKTNAIYGVLASSLSYLGAFHGTTGNVDQAEKEFAEMIDIRKKIGDPLYIMNDLTNLSNFYLLKKDFDRSIKYSSEALSLSLKSGIKADRKPLLFVLGAAYKSKGDLISYSSVLERYIVETDSFLTKNAAEKIAEVESKYELQKKQALIAEQALTISKRNNTIVISAFLFILLVGAALLAFFNFKRKQRIKSRQAVEEAENKERARIAAELHDNMGVQANAILHNSNLLGEQLTEGNEIVSNLKDTAKEMLGNLRETVWALKATNVPAGEVWLRVINFIKQTGKNFPAIKFNLIGSTPQDWSLTSVRALHMIMVLKESVNNAIKHSDSQEINVNSIITNQTWDISVMDKGKGFDQLNPSINDDGNGLSNIKARAVAGKFTVDIQSSPGNGTTVSISFPRESF